MSEIREVMQELKSLMLDASKAKSYDDRSAGYSEGYQDALSEVYDMLLLYEEEDSYDD